MEESATSTVRKKSIRSQQSLLRLSDMCKALFAAVVAQHRCNGERVFSALDAIRQRLQYTPPVLICRARVYYDSGDYTEVILPFALAVYIQMQAAKVYETLLKQFSWSTRGMEHYSTTLWHLHRPHELSRLCLLMEHCYRYAPEVIGFVFVHYVNTHFRRGCQLPMHSVWRSNTIVRYEHCDAPLT